MQTYIQRHLSPQIAKDIESFPAVVLLGPRQCGKTTLVQALGREHSDFTYLDLQRPQDLRRIEDPELFLETNANRIICLDEIQRLPGLFAILRGFIDRRERRTKLLLLGSASPDLVKKSAESLAGRAVYRELAPFTWPEIKALPERSLRELWLRGGFPESLLAISAAASWEWRASFLRTIVERDIPGLVSSIPAAALYRFIRMLSHVHGQVLNLSALGNSLGVSGHTIRTWLDLLAGTFHVRLLEPLQAKTGKRLVKSPKLYLRDSGILHSLIETESFDDLLAHPAFGASWEGFVLEQVQSSFPEAQYSYYRTASGVEADLVVEMGRRRFVIETKASSEPAPTKAFWTALDDLEPQRSWIVAPIESGWPLRGEVEVTSLPGLLNSLGRELDSA